MIAFCPVINQKAPTQWRISIIQMLGLVWSNCGLAFVKDGFQFSYICLRIPPATYWYTDKLIQEDVWWVNYIDIYILENQIMQGSKHPWWMAPVVIMGLKIRPEKKVTWMQQQWLLFKSWMWMNVGISHLTLNPFATSGWNVGEDLICSL